MHIHMANHSPLLLCYYLYNDIANKKHTIKEATSIPLQYYQIHTIQRDIKQRVLSKGLMQMFSC